MPADGCVACFLDSPPQQQGTPPSPITHVFEVSSYSLSRTRIHVRADQIVLSYLLAYTYGTRVVLLSTAQLLPLSLSLPTTALTAYRGTAFLLVKQW